MYCPLTSRQRLLYQGIKNKISIEDLLNSATSSASQAQSTANSLMNIVMQFRKVGYDFSWYGVIIKSILMSNENSPPTKMTISV